MQPHTETHLARLLIIGLLLTGIVALGASSAAWATPLQRPAGQTVPPDDGGGGGPSRSERQTATAWSQTSTAVIATRTAFAQATPTFTPTLTLTPSATPSATPTLVDTPTPTFTATATPIVPVELPETGGQLVPVHSPDTSGEGLAANSPGRSFWFWVGIALVSAGMIAGVLHLRWMRRH